MGRLWSEPILSLVEVFLHLGAGNLADADERIKVESKHA